MNIVIKFLLITLLLFASAQLIDGIHVANLYIAAIVALLWGVLSVTIKPLLTLLTLPIQIISLGLFSIVVNAALILFLASFVEGFTVDGFWPAALLALIMAIANTLVNMID